MRRKVAVCAVLGTVALLQPVDRDDLSISQHFWLLGLFGLLHGSKEFFDAWVIGNGAGGSAIGWTGSLLLAVSFVPLLEFGRRVSANTGRERDAVWVPLTSPWIHLPVLLTILAVVAASADRTAALSATARYLIGFPGAILAGLMIFCLASLGCLLSQSVWTFLFFRMLQGAIVSGYAVSLAVVRDTTDEGEAASRIGYLAMSWAFAPMLGPMFGGALDELFGWRASF